VRLPDKKLRAVFENYILHNITFLRDMFAALGLQELAEWQQKIFTVFLVEIEKRKGGE
jgi:hypothetical protein